MAHFSSGAARTHTQTLEAAIGAETMQDGAPADATASNAETTVNLSPRQGAMSETLNETDDASAMCKPARKVEPEPCIDLPSNEEESDVRRE